MDSGKPVIMMHIVMPGHTGGPNVSASRIMGSRLRAKYDFVPLNQTRVAGGRLNLGLIRELRDEIRSMGPDLVHVSGLQSAGFHCALAARLAGCRRILVSIHGFSGDSIRLSSAKRWVFNNVIEPITLRIATKVHAISKYVLERPMTRRHAKGKACHIYNLPPVPDTDAVHRDIRGELGFTREDVLVSTVGRIVIDKGHRELACAIKKLDDLANLRFLVVGDGAYTDTFVALVRDEIDSGRVLMLGKRNDVMDIMRASDIFALPSLHENLGLVFLEASAAGNALIGTDVGGVPEIIADKQTGILIPAYDSTALASAIRCLYESPAKRKEYGQNALERINTVFAVERIEHQFDSLYTALLAC